MSNGYASTKFLCDPTVGRLCRHLRMIGYDALLARTPELREILSAALIENRTILTRNSVLAGMKLARNAILLRENDPWKQLVIVIHECGLEIARGRILSRCLEDNELLTETKKEDIKGKVWPYVYQTQDRFVACPKCGRIYWPATHVQAMMSRLESEGLL